MNYSFIVRKAVPEDAESIAYIMKESFKKYIENTGLSTSMDALSESTNEIISDIENKEVYISLIDNKPVSSIRLQLNPDDTSYISRFGVVSSYHNIGIGKTMMTFADKVNLEHGVKRTYLHTASKHSSLVRFYYGCGFYVQSTTTDRGYVRALMVKEY